MRTRFLIGIDEVGRGPLAGPLCVGACLVPFRSRARVLAAFKGVRDCKRLTPEAREEWLLRVRAAEGRKALRAVTAFVGQMVIDKRGMSKALSLGIRRCLLKLAVSPEESRVILDGGIKAPAEFLMQETIIDGDETEPLISLASIVAKVRRDRRMTRLALAFPRYGFAEHKGYGTKKHYQALRLHGPCELHRRSFLKNL